MDAIVPMSWQRYGFIR